MGRASVVLGTSRAATMAVYSDISPEPGPITGLTMVELVWMPLHGQVWGIVEGDNLPGWNPGVIPLHFDSVDDLLAYPERFQRADAG